MEHLERIKQMAEVGDKMAEALEGLENDEVISAYLRKLNWASLPSFIKACDAQWNTASLRNEWDEVIGELQEEKIVGPFSENADMEYSEIYSPEDEEFRVDPQTGNAFRVVDDIGSHVQISDVHGGHTNVILKEEWEEWEVLGA